MADNEFMSPEELTSNYENGKKFDVMKILGIETLPNVEFDSDMSRGDFFMVRRQWTDGTHALAYMKMGEMLQELLNQTPYYNQRPPIWENLAQIKYRIGPLALVEGLDESRQDFRKWKELFLMPVKCEYIYRDSSQTSGGQWK